MSDEKDDDNLTLRDKFAIQIMNGMFSSLDQEQTSFMVDYYDSDDKDQARAARGVAQRLVRAAYFMADIMRKVRLAPFE